MNESCGSGVLGDGREEVDFRDGEVRLKTDLLSVYVAPLRQIIRHWRIACHFNIYEFNK